MLRLNELSAWIGNYGGLLFAVNGKGAEGLPPDGRSVCDVRPGFTHR